MSTRHGQTATQAQAGMELARGAHSMRAEEAVDLFPLHGDAVATVDRAGGLGEEREVLRPAAAAD